MVYTTFKRLTQCYTRLTQWNTEILERMARKRVTGVTSDDVEFGTADLGNRYTKGMVTGHKNTAVSYPNTVVVFDESQWRQIAKRAQYTDERARNTKTFAFRKRDGSKDMVYVAVGEQAEQRGRRRIMTQEIKYDYDSYWGAQICSFLLDHWPNGHDNLVLGVAHPTRSFAQLDKLMDETVGHHYVLLPNGDKVKWTVREMVPWDEPVGGILSWAERETAQFNSFDIRNGDTILVTDIGGGVTSYTKVIYDKTSTGQIKLTPIYEDAELLSIGMGIRDVLERLRGILKSDHEEFYGMKDVSDRMLEEGIMYGEIRLKGVPINVVPEVERAEAQLLDQMETLYLNDLNGGRDFPVIVNTGGGMHAYYDRLVKELYNHPSVDVATDTSRIHFANMNGGDVMFVNWITSKRRT